MKLFLAISFILGISITGFSQKPTNNDIATAMKRFWEQDKGPRKTVTIHSIKIGSSQTANIKHQVEGIPKGRLVTNAEIDWTHHTHYTDKTVHARRIYFAWVYKDDKGKWRVKTYRSTDVKD